MAKRGPTHKHPAHTPLDPQGLPGYAVAFAEWMRATQFSVHTVRTRGNALAFFLRWCDERGLTRPSDINRAILERYRQHTYQYRQANGKPLGLPTQASRLIAVRVFFKWLARQHHILYNPAAELEMPRRARPLPGQILTVPEVEAILNQTRSQEPLGLRDRALLETLYSTGIRRSELIHLTLYDLALDAGTVMIRQGKGRKDRVVPIGERAIAWLDKYLLAVRPTLVTAPDDGTVFLTLDGEAISTNRLSELAHGYVQAAHPGRAGACHVFRHAMATHMLEGGADIRVIQAILGHDDLGTTAVYTHVSIQHLKQVHTQTHPAKLTRAAAGVTTVNDPQQTAALLSALAADAAEERAEHPPAGS